MASKRPPIVVVLGHVDHGKTTLLDAIRKTDVASREAGGITQSIGASKIRTKQGEITFIDTPGHAAFSSMRDRGARIADIALLVVAADDGVKPQTAEALEYLKNAETSFIVVLSKIDLSSADPEKAISQLEKLGVSFEGRGGNTPLVKVSAKTGQGLEELLEVMMLFFELNKADASVEKLVATVIESGKDKRGLFASIVVKSGSLSVGDLVFVDEKRVKVRGIFDVDSRPLKSVLAGNVALVLGFSEPPPIGSPVFDVPSGVPLAQKVKKTEAADKGEEEDFNILVKADSVGAIEAIKNSLPKAARVIDSSVGDVNESDVFMAKTGQAMIVAFKSRIPKQVKNLAQTDGVQIISSPIIYEVIDRLLEKIKAKKGEVTASAQILAVFPFDDKKVAGCKVTEGEIKVGDKLTLMREGRPVGGVKVNSMKREKAVIELAKAGEECGLIFTPKLDFTKGDMLISVKI